MGHDGSVPQRVPLPDLLTSCGVIAPLPALPASELYAACEIMIQEGVRAWTLPWPAADTLRDLWDMFAGRAVIGVRGRVPVEDLAVVQKAGGSFVAQALARSEVVLGGAERGLPVIAGALTPTEIVRAWGLGPSAVQLVPAEGVDAGLAELLETEVPGVRLVVTGRVDSVAAEKWYERGVVAVCPTADLVGNALSGGVLMGLRVRSRDYSSAYERVRVAREEREGLPPAVSERKLRNT
jgi:2-dehydro-3-deoxyphosphogluconate aldolase/(4S)-4-hydroxy-2-oxoglutarate aldolase